MRSAPIVAAVLLAALLLAGCGKSRADRVNDYFGQANKAQLQLRDRLRKLDLAYAGFSRGKPTPAQRRAIDAAPTLFHRLRERLVQLDPPPDARPIHRDLLRLVAMVEGLAREVRTTAAYLPAYRGAVAPVTPATTRFSRTLRAAKTPGEQAAAFRRYAKDLRAPVAALRALEPPPALAPSRRAQLLRLERTRRSAAHLGEAFAQRRRRELPRLVEELRRASAASNTEAETAAITAYNRRVGAISRLAGQIERRRLALQKRLSR